MIINEMWYYGLVVSRRWELRAGVMTIIYYNNRDINIYNSNNATTTGVAIDYMLDFDDLLRSAVLGKLGLM